MTAVDTLPGQRGGFRRPTWQEAVAEFLPESWRPRARPFVEHGPLIVVALLTTVLAVFLRNTAFIDEALYINAGKDYLNGVQGLTYGQSFSGVPFLYPVLAACLDLVGGLYLVRAASLVAILVTIWLVHDFTRTIFNSRRTGILAAAAFGLTGPVAFVGFLGTFDAVTIMLIALAMKLAVTRDSLWSGAGIGALVALFSLVKYTGAVFGPVVLGLVFLYSTRRVARTVVAVGTAAALLVGSWMVLAPQIAEGVRFTTTGRSALAPAPQDFLIEQLVLNIGLLGVTALIGTLLIPTMRERLVAVGLLAAAAVLPLAQLHLGEDVSFSKHNAYSALFLAPLAGYALGRLSRRMFKLAPVALILVLAFGIAASRAAAMYTTWLNVEPVVHALDIDNNGGVYISSATDSLRYYTMRADSQIEWDTTFELYVRGESGIREAVQERDYDTVILRAESTGNPDQDAGQAVFLAALDANPSYELTKVAGENPADQWLIYTLHD